MAECILIKSGQVPDEYRGGVFRPTQTDQIIIPNEGMALGDVIIQGEPNFAAENIRYGVSMWGEVGTCNEYTPIEGYWLLGENYMTSVTGGYSFKLYATGSGTSGEIVSQADGMLIRSTKNQNTIYYQGDMTMGAECNNYLDLTGIRKITFNGVGWTSQRSWTDGDFGNGIETSSVVISIVNSAGAVVAYKEYGAYSSWSGADFTAVFDTTTLTGNHKLRMGIGRRRNNFSGGFAYDVYGAILVKEIMYETMYVQS